MCVVSLLPQELHVGHLTSGEPVTVDWVTLAWNDLDVVSLRFGRSAPHEMYVERDSAEIIAIAVALLSTQDPRAVAQVLPMRLLAEAYASVDALLPGRAVS